MGQISFENNRYLEATALLSDGHSSPTTTSVYLQYSLKDLHEDYDKVWEEDEREETKD
ncbi:unnamed protein product [marine sediment metagenome]|uniref:Uncharacterized protein n=1 Tax=marine sediment metagenome TaxID=412755 RepID=X1FV50_9ZZZZ